VSVESRSVRKPDFDLLWPPWLKSDLEVEPEPGAERLTPAGGELDGALPRRAVAGSLEHAGHFISALRWLGVSAAIGWPIVAALIYSVAREPGYGR